MEPKLDPHIERNLNSEIKRGLHQWATYICLALAIFSAQILFSVANIDVSSWATSIVYGTSVCGFFYFYLIIGKFVVSDRKDHSTAK
jgi:hypothetical protein